MRGKEEVPAIGLGGVVAVAPGKGLAREEGLPVRVESVDVGPFGFGSAKGGSLLALGAAFCLRWRVGVLLFIEGGEQAAVDPVEAILVISKTVEAAGVEVGPYVHALVVHGALALHGAIAAAQNRFSMRIVPGALLRIVEHSIRALDLLELAMGLLLLIHVLVWMPFERQFSIGRLQFVRGGRALDPQNLVVAPHRLPCRHRFQNSIDMQCRPSSSTLPHAGTSSRNEIPAPISEDPVLSRALNSIPQIPPSKKPKKT